MLGTDPMRRRLSFATFGLATFLLAAGHALAQPTPSAPPSFSIPVDGTVGEGFGPRMNPADGQPKFHQGLDFIAPIGTQVKASAAGTVSFVGDLPGFGTVIKIDHNAGMATRYTHLSRTDVKEGDTVSAGQVIGAVGKSGWGSQPQLHFEIWRDGEPQNPADLLQLPAH
ncbi:M23 family metallopeptidase [Asticcacaulis benevestitus]|uniref:M23ase beta-sheet core domain-containing protein n=1 Tax=Asticcacaulis benevestitus DSM 16100 = ATCC BAA-896 TaxID=1121022 RepID=V4PLJ4_9CAUL|nr:M23 family metallopeptidase [Asticcacaulis benevestitus]ESQ88119.1 hypothetical protein ABENE_16450 [Asticcacaulis benevestitus DSM 16100 = ATCC BAA-896]